MPPEQAQGEAFHLPSERWELDPDEGTFEGYLAVFDEPDAKGEVVDPGAFDRTLTETPPSGHPPGKRPLLWHHDPEKPIGTLSLSTDDYGLRARGRLTSGVQLAEEAHRLLRQGAIGGMSQGFNTKKEERPPGGDVERRLLDVELFEGSLVTFPRQVKAQVGEVREGVHVRAGWPTGGGGYSERQVRSVVEEVLQEHGILEEEERSDDPDEEPDEDPDAEGEDGGEDEADLNLDEINERVDRLLAKA